MTPHDADLGQIADALARLATDPALTGGGPVARLALDASTLKIIEADEAGQALLDGALPAPVVARLMQLGGGLAPIAGVRIERLGWSQGIGALPRLTACRRARREDGSVALLLAIAGESAYPQAPAMAVMSTAVPQTTPQSRVAVLLDERTPQAELEQVDNLDVVAAAAPSADLRAGPVAAPSTALPLVADAPPAEATTSLSPVLVAPLPDKLRVLWEMDAEGRFTRLSSEAEQAIGADAVAAMIGRAWPDLAGARIVDPNSIVAKAMAERRTFSAVSTLWRLGTSTDAYRVAMSGLAASDSGRRFSGFRGFGIVHTTVREPFPVTEADVVGSDAPAQASVAAQGPSEIGSETHVDDLEPVHVADEAHEAPAVAQPPSIVMLAQGGEAAANEQVETSEWINAADAEIGKPASKETASPEAEIASNIVPITPEVTPPQVGEKPVLSRNERSAFREIARALGARIEGEPTTTREASQSADPVAAPADTSPMDEALPKATPAETDFTDAGPGDVNAAADLVASMRDRLAEQARERTGEVIRFAPPQRARDDAFADLIDKLPIGVLVMREERIVYANRTLVDLLDYADVEQLAAAGSQALFAAPAPDEGGGVLALRRNDGGLESVDARLSAISWNGEPATLMSFRRAVETAEPPRLAALKLDLDKAKGQGAELSAILDTATDGVVTLDDRGRILSLNKSAEALFGFDQREVIGENLTLLLAPETHITALDYLDGLKGGGVASLMNDGREVQGRVRQGGRIPLFMTMGRISDTPERKFAAVLRDMTAWKKAEAELIEARRAAERASAQKSDVLAKISHEIRTPLNAIIGFTEVMSEERFGPIGNERYKEYLRDIHDSGGYVISLVNDLLDLAKIEAGKMDLSFTAVSLNDVAANAVALLQPEANRQRVVLRSGLQPKLPSLVADERSLRQIVLNVLSNAVKFTDAGGQVILSTALSDRGEVILRVRDTGIGMTDKELEQALEPFRQVSATRRGTGTGLGLPITKALVEANKGALRITSARGEGTLVEIAFPPQRVLAS